MEQVSTLSLFYSNLKIFLHKLKTCKNYLEYFTRSPHLRVVVLFVYDSGPLLRTAAIRTTNPNYNIKPPSLLAYIVRLLTSPQQRLEGGCTQLCRNPFMLFPDRNPSCREQHSNGAFSFHLIYIINIKV